MKPLDVVILACLGCFIALTIYFTSLSHRAKESKDPITVTVSYLDSSQTVITQTWILHESMKVNSKQGTVEIQLERH